MIGPRPRNAPRRNPPQLDAGLRRALMDHAGAAVQKLAHIDVVLGERRLAHFADDDGQQVGEVGGLGQLPGEQVKGGGALLPAALGRLLGAQMLGAEGVSKRVDVVAAALHARMTVEQVAELDLSYAPPFSTVWDPVLIAAQEMLRELRR